ncbi:MAG: Anaerobic sulfatase-maturating enzyme [Smithella sp. PtaU1.Bin162]|nr:MAG: Anaerobic sulfatase-maturating enzyme [Smithella sp. PtaU1.Bin162]
MEAKLKQSDYLQIIPRAKGGYVVYHSLYGNLKQINQNILELLNKFKNPISPAILFREQSGNGIGKTINELTKLHYLVPLGDDERTFFNEKLAQRENKLTTGYYIGALQLSIAESCNFNCKYCFADWSDNGSKRRLELKNYTEKLMSFEMASKTIQTVIDVLKANGKKRLIIKFFGREPLINWRVIKRVMEHFGNGEEHGLYIRWDMTTNGSLITEECAQLFSKYKGKVYISIDGLAETNDVNRITTKGENTFKAIEKGIDLMLKHGVEVFTSSVISSLNFDHFDNRMTDYTKSKGIKTLILLLAFGNEYLMNQRTHTTEEIVNKFYSLYRYAVDQRMNIAGYWHNPLRRLLFSKSYQISPWDAVNEDHNSCPGTGMLLAVEPSGDIFPCRAMSLHLGHIDEFDKMLKSDVYRSLVMRTYMNVNHCRGCALEGVCQGECLGHSEYKFNDIYQPDERFCEIYRGITRKILSES